MTLVLLVIFLAACAQEPNFDQGDKAAISAIVAMVLYGCVLIVDWFLHRKRP